MEPEVAQTAGENATEAPIVSSSARPSGSEPGGSVDATFDPIKSPSSGTRKPATPSSGAVSPLQRVMKTVREHPLVQQYRSQFESVAHDSHLPFITSNAVHALSWADPITTAACLFATLTLYITFNLMGLSLLRIAAAALLCALTVCAVIIVHNALQASPGDRLPVPRVQLDRNALRDAAASFITSCDSAVTAVNGWLTWSDIPSSLRAFVYLWIVSSYADSLVGINSIFMCILALFALIPAYVMSQKALDSAVWAKAQPILAQGASKLRDGEREVRTQLATVSRTVLLASLTVGSAAMLYIFWDQFSIFGTISLFAHGWAARDALYAAAAIEPRSQARTAPRKAD